MWHAGREAFLFWTLVGLATCVVLFLIGKAVITYMILQRESKPDEHATHPGIG